MDIANYLSLLGGISMFLFGMHVMGDGLEKCAGNQLKTILEKLTSSTFKGFLLGLGVTLLIQSSCATAVMVVGFVNSGLMTLHQATGVIMGANLGTSVTAWLLATSGIEGEGILQLLKPESFAPIFAFLGIILYMFQKNKRKKDIGLIFVGFGVLMIGMNIMSSAVAPLKDSPTFQSILIKFANPIIGVCRYFAGIFAYRRGYVQRCNPDHRRAEYRHMLQRHALLHRCGQERTPRFFRSSVFQCFSGNYHSTAVLSGKFDLQISG